MRRGCGPVEFIASSSRAIHAYSAFFEIRMRPPSEEIRNPKLEIRNQPVPLGCGFGISDFGFPAGLDAAPALVLDHVQAALFLLGARPAAGAFVLALAHRGGAGPAPDARVAVVMQWIVGNLMGNDEGPHLFTRPRQERTDLHEAELGVPLHKPGAGPVLGLVAADGAEPALLSHPRPAQRPHLAVVAALIGPDPMERTAVLGLVLLDRQFRPDEFDLDAVAFLDALAQFE